VEAESTGLHDPPDFINLDFWLWEHRKVIYSELFSNVEVSQMYYSKV
jgi:hypothetical protein